MLALDDICKLEETLSGAGTSHWVNSSAVLARHFGPNLHLFPGIEQARTRKRIIDPSLISAVPLYNAGDRCGPRTRTFVEVTAEEILVEARNKNLLWNLVQLHAEVKQEASGWTGFNISVRTSFKSHRMSSDICRLLTHLLLTWLPFTRFWCSRSRSRARSNWRASFSSSTKHCMQRQLRSSGNKVRGWEYSTQPAPCCPLLASASRTWAWGTCPSNLVW